jgi:ComF family protein
MVKALMPIRSGIQEGVLALITLLYPAHCGACGCRLDDEGEEDEEGKEGSWNEEKDLLCGPCRAAILMPPEHLCPVCSHPMQGRLFCPNCEGRRWHLSVIVPGCRYEGLARDLIQRFKYGRDQSLMRLLGDLMIPALNDLRLEGKQFDALVPVPLHPIREREREFNQADLLARRLAKRIGVPVANLMKRTRATAPQAGFDRTHRLENLEGAFEMRRPVEEGATLLLVDDVTTTGTTLNACAALLMEAGAGEVCAVTVARG